MRLTKHLSYAPSAYISQSKISYVTMYASTMQPKETVKAMRMVLSYMKNQTYSDKLMANVLKGHLLSYVKRQEVMSEITDQLGKAEIMGDWKLAENLAATMSKVTAKEMKTASNRYAKNIKWAYIGDPALAAQSFNQ